MGFRWLAKKLYKLPIMKLLNILSILLLVITPTIWAQEQDYNAELVDTVQHVPILVEHAGMATGLVTDV